MDTHSIIVRGAREHNLRNVNLELPRNQLICFTGVSGSGKSSLAFDTLYAEGQRRYVESLSSYARQFLGQLPKPDVDYIGGLSPAISIQQKTASRNPRSTVGTVTEISDFLRVLYARIGKGHCPQCQRPITAQTRDQIIGRILALPPGTAFLILAPMVRGQKGEFRDFFADMLKRGFVRARVDGQIVRLTDDLQLNRRIKHDIDLVIDRLKNDPKNRTRLAEAVEQALGLAEGNLIVSIEADRAKAAEVQAEVGEDDAEVRTSRGPDELLLSAHYACVHCNISYDPPTPQLFSFNSPRGMCLTCDGLGTQFTFDPDLLIPDQNLSIAKGAVPIIGSLTGMGRWRKHIYEGVAKALEIDLKKPWKQLSDREKQLYLYGAGDQKITFEWKQRGGGVWRHAAPWEGVIPQLLASFKKTAAGPRRMQLEKYMRIVRCPSCKGHRLNSQARAVQVGEKTLVELGSMPIGDLAPWLDRLEPSLSRTESVIAGELLKEIRARLGFLLNVGLHYLSLDRSAPTLSGGEAQRIRLAGQIGSGLVGVLYILDEPSIGLHPRDNLRLLRSLEKLRDMGNTVLVVEHDEDTMRAADFLVDFGPGPGVKGGQIVSVGTPYEVVRDPNSLTGAYLSGRKEIAIPTNRRPMTERKLVIEGARHHNLRNLRVEIPLGCFVAVTGVSGSGKSSLVNDILMRGLVKLLRPTGRKAAAEETDDDDDTESAIAEIAGDCDAILGYEQIDKVIDIDQKPIGRTPRSNPSTYIKVWDEIRILFAEMNEAKVRGYQPGRFSFNRPGGRCESCEGNGSNKLEMDFLADVWVQCPVCEGKRFNRETLQVRYRGKNIHDVLEMDVQEALELFENHPKIRNMLQTLHDVGLDYLKLGQPSPTLSGGEAQRIKLAKELCRRSSGKTLYVLDEPTTGLHFEDIRKLLEVLHGFVNAGNSVIVIEHNLDVIKTADWLIDMGPDGGSGGGQVVVAGTPETVAECTQSFTGEALRPILQRIIPEIPKKPKSKRGKAAIPNERITHLRVDGASQHNLKHISVAIPREEMTVCSGPSGSGKSTLALDTIYAEGQRRYVESLSSYARQFLGQVQKPKVESITGLSPAISIEQKTTSKSPRSTVGTITEIYDYLRVLYARLGQLYCPACAIPVGTQTADEIIEQILGLPEGTKLYIMAPLERKGQEKYESLFDEARRSGFLRIRVDGKSFSLDEPPTIDHRRQHRVEIIVDRNVVREGTRTRIADSVETALSVGRGVMHLAYVEADRDEATWKVDVFSQHLACHSCGRSFEQLNPHHFSFNSPLGWCPTCEGLGVQRGANSALLMRDSQQSLRDGAIAAWPPLTPENPFLAYAEAIAKHLGINLDTPFDKLDATVQRALLYGTGETELTLHPAKPSSKKFQYKGVFPALDEAARVSYVYRSRLDHLMDEVPCSACHGSRLRDDASSVQFDRVTLRELCELPIGEVLARVKRLELPPTDRQVAEELLREITNRLQFLIDVGLDYLSLGRPGPTLSGGEAQRIRLASQIGSGLTGVLYVLDEPTIGLHPRDNTRLLKALQKLRDLGNTLLLVEHDREVIQSADYLLDFGPGAGDRGGEITAAGTPSQIQKVKQSLTGQYLSGKMAIAVPTNRRVPTLQPKETPEQRMANLRTLRVVGARHHNLKNVTVDFPLGCLISVTGVSGSGKSSLINEVLYNTLARKLHRARTSGAAHDEIVGLDQIDKIINVDQDPIGNSPSSNPATYTGVFELIRQLYSQMPESKVRGYQPRRFSFNHPGGRCEACEGNGQKKIEMHFLPDVWVECDVCHGKRYNPETLAVQYKGKSISDVLTMRVSEALELFRNIPKIRHILQTLVDVGLDYLSLGQSAPTMSGGEAQRVKLAAELSRPSTGRTLYLLDEPTTGLHFDDVRKLLEVLHRLVDLGNTVIVVEHNLDVMKSSDWIIDIGPEAGLNGGQVVACGTPEEVVAQAKRAKPVSHTGKVLAEVLAAGPFAERTRFDPLQMLQAQEGDVSLESVGADAKLPWEADGVRWHTQDRITTTGKRCLWDGSILTWLTDKIAKTGNFSEPNWNSRTIVEVAAKKKSLGWFLHAMTGMESYLRLVFHVHKQQFKSEKLARDLALPEFASIPELATLNREDRVSVKKRNGIWHEVVILAYRREELDTPAFEQFLTDAMRAFQVQLTEAQTNVENVMPWKLNGEKWHLGEKGFPPGKGAKWDRAALPRLIELIRKIEPTIEIRWDTRDAIAFYLPGFSRFWGRFKTKESDCLECRFNGKPGAFNLTHLEAAGMDGEFLQDRKDGVDVMLLRFTNANPMVGNKLRDLLQRHLQGFRERFAGDSDAEAD
ncbi:excinuclease ABC subunit UvrA [Tuwongella immobilis]|nr:excinuclease ABC subunit UvrA [Tuwongella immobilis]